MEQSIYELYMEQVNPQDTREIMQAEDALTELLKLVATPLTAQQAALPTSEKQRHLRPVTALCPNNKKGGPVLYRAS